MLTAKYIENLLNATQARFDFILNFANVYKVNKRRSLNTYLKFNEPLL